MSAFVEIQPSPSSSSTNARYQVGTLSYTKAGLITLFAWLLWGDFCFMLMETVVPSIAPLQLRHLDAPNWVIAFIMSTLPGVLNMTVCPWVSFKSDRYRSRWGRRIPFILSTLPFLVLFLVLMGFAAPIGRYVHQTIFSQTAISPTVVTVACLGVFMVGFQFFNMFVNSVFWYLFNDVVPQHFMGRFLGLFRVICGLVGVFFNFFVYRFAETHATLIYCSVAALYAIGFGLMCLKVKEGGYPPPELSPARGFINQIKVYCKECYSQRYYWNLFLYTTCWSVGLTIMVFNVFFNKDIGLDLGMIGIINGICGVMSILLTYPAGILADRYHPLRVLLWAHRIFLLIAVLPVVWLFINPHPNAAFYLATAFSILTTPMYIVIDAMTLPNYMRLLPHDRFGQFASAQSLIRSAGTMLGGLLAGLFLDVMRHIHGNSDFGFRYCSVWTLFWAALALFFLHRLHGDWIRHQSTPHETH